MLIDKYLPDYQFAFGHSIEIDAPIDHVYKVVRNFDLTEATLLRFLFWVRSIPAKLMGQQLLGPTLPDLQRAGVYILDEVPESDFLLAFTGKLWTGNPELLHIDKDDFRDYVEPEFAKAIWGFSLSTLPGGRTLLTTETRAQCVDEVSKRMFRRYLVLIRPLSKITRKSALRAFKRQAEK